MICGEQMTYTPTREKPLRFADLARKSRAEVSNLALDEVAARAQVHA